MAHLFSNIEDLKLAVGGAVNNDDNFFAAIVPYIAESDEKHLLPWFGSALWAKILTPPAGEPSALTVLRGLVKRASGFLALSEYTAIGDIQFGEKGRIRADLTPYKYQEEKQDLKLLESGYQAIEKALIFVNENTATVTDWVNTEGYQKHRGLFLNTAADMKWYYGKAITRYIFEQLRPIIEDLEDGALRVNFPKAFLTTLLAHRNANTLTATEVKVLTLLKKAVTHFSMSEAITKSFARIDGKGNVVISMIQDADGKGSRANTPETTSYSATWNNLWANRHMVAVKDYIIENKADFLGVFAVADGGANTDADAWDLRTFEVKYPDEIAPVWSERKIVIL